MGTEFLFCCEGSGRPPPWDSVIHSSHSCLPRSEGQAPSGVPPPHGAVYCDQTTFTHESPPSCQMCCLPSRPGPMMHTPGPHSQELTSAHCPGGAGGLAAETFSSHGTEKTSSSYVPPPPWSEYWNAMTGNGPDAS